MLRQHRKGATGDVLLTFKGAYTRFQNPEDDRFAPAADMGGEIIGSRLNGGDDVPPPYMDDPLMPPPDRPPF